MKRFRITAALPLALSLALTLLPVGAFADEPALAKLPITPILGTATSAEEVVDPILDLVFCIDTSASMEAHLSTAKATVQSLIRREKARYPGHTVRLGLVRYGDASKVHFSLDLSEDQDLFLRSLQDTVYTATVLKDPGNVLDYNVEKMTWAENGVRRMYMIGNEFNISGPRKGVVYQPKDIEIARKHKIIISTAYCYTGPFGDPEVSDELNARSWVGGDSGIKSVWIELAKGTGGEFIQIFSKNDSVTYTGLPLLGFVWDSKTVGRFYRYFDRIGGQTGHSYMYFDRIGGQMDLMTFDEYRKRYYTRDNALLPRQLLVDFLTIRLRRKVQFWGDEARVIRWFEQHPSKATYLLRP